MSKQYQHNTANAMDNLWEKRPEGQRPISTVTHDHYGARVTSEQRVALNFKIVSR